MPIEIPDLWDDDIKVDVLPPLVILKAQDEAIRRKTEGILRTQIVSREIEREPEDDEEETKVDVVYTLDLEATALGYRESILNVFHRKGRLYPVTITMPEKIEWSTDPSAYSYSARCASSDEFIQHLRVALRSEPTKSTLASLLAMINETKLK